MRLGTYLLVKKRFGERQPPFDGHDHGHATGAQPEEPPQDADPAYPHAPVRLGEVNAGVHEHERAGERDAIVGGQTAQHEPVFLVAAGPGPVQDEQRQHVAEYAYGVRHGHADLDAERRPGGGRHGRCRRRRHSRVRHGLLHRIAIVF